MRSAFLLACVFFQFTLLSCASNSNDPGESAIVEEALARGLSFCGDDVCGAGENCVSCREDCGECTASCGDVVCGAGESCVNCPNDCGVCEGAAELCGDGICTDDESCVACEQDCGACNNDACGNGLCTDDESCESCAQDCGACENENACGDGTCDANENCESCSQDCGPCAPDNDPPGNQGGGVEDEMLRLVNNFRQSGGSCPSGSFQPMGALSSDDVLGQVARSHSQDMGQNGYFSHTSQDGRSPFDRIRDAGYGGAGRGENIAAGNATAQATFNQWVNSDGHCRNMSNPNFNEIGIGYANVGGSPFRHYWTQVFGVR